MSHCSYCCYAVHYGRTAGIFSTYDQLMEQVKDFRGAVYARCQSTSEARHFVQHGVLPVLGDCSTIHMFLCIDGRKYVGYSSETQHMDGSVPSAWRMDTFDANRSMELCALLAFSAALDHLFDHKRCSQPVVVHMEHPYVHNCVSKWMKTWRKQNWCKTDGTKVQHAPLMQIIDAQLAKFAKLTTRFWSRSGTVDPKNISGFRQARRLLSVKE